jgi:hypothetical protein
MTDQTPPPTVADLPANGKVDDAPADELEGQWQLYATGGASVKIDGKVYRLRRPDMGQIRKLRGALAATADSIRYQSEASQLAQLKRQAGDEKLSADLERLVAMDPKPEDYEAQLDAIFAQRRELGDADRQAGRGLTNAIDDAYSEWWRLVFETLTLSGIPERWPSWAGDAISAQQIMQHWRENPLARG